MIRNTTFCLLAAVALLASCGSKDETPKTDAAIPVITATVKNSSTNASLSVSGNIEGNTTVRIGFMVAGKINYIAVQEGQPVTKGQLVASLDPANYSIAKQLADVQVNQAMDEFKRVKILHDRNSISESDYNKVGFAVDQAKTQQQLQAKNLSDTKLFSPISGILLKKMAEVGEITGQGNPILVISDIAKVKVSAYIPENDLHSVRIGQTAEVEITALGSTHTGKVTEVGSAADPTSRSFTVKIELDNPKLLIRPGMIAEIRISGNETREVVTISPESILRDTDGQSYVYVVSEDQHKAFKRKIILGALNNNLIEVTSGLKAGDILVTGGQHKLSDGSLITLTK